MTITLTKIFKNLSSILTKHRDTEVQSFLNEDDNENDNEDDDLNKNLHKSITNMGGIIAIHSLPIGRAGGGSVRLFVGGLPDYGGNARRVRTDVVQTMQSCCAWFSRWGGE